MTLVSVIVMNAVLAVLLVSALLTLLGYFGVYEGIKHEKIMLWLHRNKTSKVSV